MTAPQSVRATDSLSHEARPRGEGIVPNPGGAGLEIPGPPHWAPIQSLICLLTWPERAEHTARRLGDIFQIRLLMPREPEHRTRWPVVSGKAVLVSSPELLRELFSRSGPELAGGAARQFMEWFEGPDSLLILDGQEHREERRALLTLFTSERLAQIEAVTESVTEEVLARLPPAGTMALAPFLSELIGEIAVRLMFGPIEERTRRTIWAWVQEGSRSPGWAFPFVLLPGLRKGVGSWSPGGRALRALAEFRKLLASEVALTREGGRPEGTWLAQLLALEPDGRDDPASVNRRVARAFTILGAMESIPAALHWTFYELLREPAAMARAREAADSGRNDYVEAVCKEAARLHPPVPILSRRVMSPTTLGGYRLDSGSYLVGAIYLTHRRPELYPEPHRFLPERFLTRAYSPFEFLPFGGGVRRCLGHGFGLRQAAQVLYAMLRSFDLTGIVRSRLRMLRRGVLVIPSDPLRVSFRRRSAG